MPAQKADVKMVISKMLKYHVIKTLKIVYSSHFNAAHEEQKKSSKTFSMQGWGKLLQEYT